MTEVEWQTRIELIPTEERGMSEQEHEQRDEETPEREETIQDLDVPEEEGQDVAGGRKAGGKQDEY